MTAVALKQGGRAAARPKETRLRAGQALLFLRTKILPHLDKELEPLGGAKTLSHEELTIEAARRHLGDEWYRRFRRSMLSHEEAEKKLNERRHEITELRLSLSREPGESSVRESLQKQLEAAERDEVALTAKERRQKARLDQVSAPLHLPATQTHIQKVLETWNERRGPILATRTTVLAHIDLLTNAPERDTYTLRVPTKAGDPFLLGKVTD
jgi:hypothetical protein